MTPSRGRPPGRSARGAETRARLYDVATRLFAERGYEATTMRAIAETADVSPGLLYRYFPSKAAVVMALYERLSEAFDQRCASIPPGAWAERAARTLEASLATLRDHRDVLRAVLPVLLADPDLGLFSPAGAPGRERVRARFVRAVTESVDGPADPELAGALGRLLDLAQLGVILWWLLDRSPGCAATEGLLALIRSIVPAIPALLWLPGAAGGIQRLDQLAAAALYGERSS